MKLDKLEMKSFHVRLYFDTLQKQVLRQWMGVSRIIYNNIIAKFKQDNNKPKKKDVRQWIKDNDKSFDWFKQVPYNIKDETITQALAAIEGYKTRVSQGNNGGILGFRTKKDLRQVLPIREQNINFKNFSFYNTTMEDCCKKINGAYKKTLKKSHQRLENKKNNIKTCLNIDQKWSDAVLCFHKKLGNWTLNARYTHLPIVRDDQSDKDDIVAIDPGVKTFATIYSPSLNCVWKIGQGDFYRLRRLSIAYYKAVSRLDKLKGKERRRKKHSADKVIHRILFKISNLKNELHKKLANWLISTFDVIILPPFNEKSCLSKKKLKKWTYKETRKDILNFSHGKFRERMKYECWKHGKKLILLNEAYTTKCCTSCGWKNNKVGNKDVFICKNQYCNMYSIDRDVNGARNICLKALNRMTIEMDYDERLAPLL